MGKTKRIIIAFVCSIALIGTSLAVPYTVFAKETKASLNKKIENAQNKIDANNKKKNKLSKEVSNLKDDIASAEAQLNKLSDEVDAAEIKLAKQKNKLEKGNKDLNSRLRNIYKGGSMGFIDVIFSSDNVSDLFSNLEMVKYIFKNDKAVVGKLKKDYKEISVLQNSLKKKEKALNAKQKELNADKASLMAQSKKLTKSNAALEEDIDQWKKDSAAITDKINSVVGGGGGYQGESTSAAGFKWPVPGHRGISSPFGYRLHPIKGQYILHEGIDIPAPYGVPVVASKPGKVILASWYYGLGNCVIIDHGGGVTTVYGHNSSLVVSAGQYVKQGQTIAKIGSTGNSTGNHCHFEVRINGSPRNPLNYL